MDLEMTSGQLVYWQDMTSQPSWRSQVAVAMLVALNQVCLDDQNKNYSSFKSTQMNESLQFFVCLFFVFFCCFVVFVFVFLPRTTLEFRYSPTHSSSSPFLLEQFPMKQNVQLAILSPPFNVEKRIFSSSLSTCTITMKGGEGKGESIKRTCNFYIVMKHCALWDYDTLCPSIPRTFFLDSTTTVDSNSLS